MEYDFHEYCLMFPQADDEILQQMAVDIRENGLNEPVVLYEGVILDGRNRYLACKIAGVEPTYVQYEGDEPLQFVTSKNLMRRHLSAGQRAELALKLFHKIAPTTDMTGDECRTMVQKAFDVSDFCFDSMVRIEKDGVPEVKKAIKDGELSLRGANEVMDKALTAVGLDKRFVVPRHRRPQFEAAQRHYLSGVDEDYVYDPDDKNNFYSEEVRQGIVSNAKYRRNITAIQKSICRIERLPTLFDDTLALVDTIEKNRMLVACCNMVLKEAKTFLHKVQVGNLSYDDVLSEVAELLNCRFRLPDIQKGAESLALSELLHRCEVITNAMIRDIMDLRKTAEARRGVADSSTVGVEVVKRSILDKMSPDTLEEDDDEEDDDAED